MCEKSAALFEARIWCFWIHANSGCSRGSARGRAAIIVHQKEAMRKEEVHTLTINHGLLIKYLQLSILLYLPLQSLSLPLLTLKPLLTFLLLLLLSLGLIPFPQFH